MPTETRPAGFIIDVPVTLSVAVRGVSSKKAKEIARQFAASLSPSDQFIEGYNEESKTGGIITEVSLESPTDESCEVLDELEEE